MYTPLVDFSVESVPLLNKCGSGCFCCLSFFLLSISGSRKANLRHLVVERVQSERMLK
jgi:hypothetical protein